MINILSLRNLLVYSLFFTIGYTYFNSLESLLIPLENIDDVNVFTLTVDRNEPLSPEEFLAFQNESNYSSDVIYYQITYDEDLPISYELSLITTDSINLPDYNIFMREQHGNGLPRYRDRRYFLTIEQIPEDRQDLARNIRSRVVQRIIETGNYEIEDFINQDSVRLRYPLEDSPDGYMISIPARDGREAMSGPIDLFTDNFMDIWMQEYYESLNN